MLHAGSNSNNPNIRHNIVIPRNRRLLRPPPAPIPNTINPGTASHIPKKCREKSRNDGTITGRAVVVRFNVDVAPLALVNDTGLVVKAQAEPLGCPEQESETLDEYTGCGCNCTW